jgi:hypothetical protein
MRAHRADIMNLAQRLGEQLQECEPLRHHQEARQRADLHEQQRRGQAPTDEQIDELNLTYLEPFIIQAVCAWCLTSSVVITLILFLSAGPARQALAKD